VCNFSSVICPNGSAPAAFASLLFALEKHSVWRLLYLFARLDLLLLFSSLTLPTFAFPSVHIVRSLTSKLPSIMYIYYMSICLHFYISPAWHWLNPEPNPSISQTCWVSISVAEPETGILKHCCWVVKLGECSPTGHAIPPKQLPFWENDVKQWIEGWCFLLWTNPMFYFGAAGWLDSAINYNRKPGSSWVTWSSHRYPQIKYWSSGFPKAS